MNYDDSRRAGFWLIIILFAFFIIYKSSFTNPQTAFALENPQSHHVIVSTSIGEPKLTLFGYTSPNALVQLEGQRVSEQVIANLDGYFFFDRIFLPLPSLQLGKITYPELCLTSIDTQSRISFPTCLPSLPIGPFEITVGPVLLSPTFTLSKGNFLPQEQIVAQGLTIPNSEVNIFLANDSPLSGQKWLNKFFRGKIISPALAYSLPQYQTKADKQGNFEFNLPTIKKANWKIFVGANFQGAQTPKSNTLNFKIQSWWEWLWGKVTSLFRGILRILRPFLWLIIILIELIVVALLLAKSLRFKVKS